MTFANPAALWLMTLVVPIVALHILRAQRTEIVVSSTVDWQSVDRPVAAARPWQRLRWSVPLVLQLLVVALIATALGGPAFDTGRISAEQVVVIVDTSASMGGTDGSPTRLAEAKDAVRDLLGDLGANTRVSLIAAGAPAQIVSSEVPLSEVGERLDQMKLSEGGFDAEAAGSLAVSLDRPDRSVEHVLVSDGGLDDAAIRLLPAGTRYVPVGRSDRNVGVTNVVVSARGAALHVQTTLTNAGSRDVTQVVRFDVDGRTAATASVKVAARGSVETAADVAPGERLEVLLEGNDLLRLDDHAYAVGPKLTTIDALLVGEPDPFLDALVAARPDVAVTRLTPDELAAKGVAGFSDIDIAIFDRVPVPDSVPVPYLAIAPPGGTSSVQVDGEVSEPVPTLVRSEVDLLAGLDLSQLAVAEAQKVSAPAASSLVAAEGTPLVVSGRDRNSPFVYLTFPLARSNLGLLPAFPVLGARIIDKLGRSDLAGGGLQVGDVIDLDAGAAAVVTSPSGTETEVRPGAASPELDRTGFWKVAIEGQGERTIVVNPDPGETKVAPIKDLAIPGVRGGLDGRGEPVTRSIVVWLIVLGLVAVVAEWWFSRRRRGVSRRQFRLSEYARAIVAALLLVALLAPSFTVTSDDVATVFVVDVSDSLAASREQVAEMLDKALAGQPSGTVAGVVVVGAAARVDAAITENLAWSSPRTVVDGSATDLAAGLRVAGALAPPDHARRVVVVSDGRPTAGGSLATETSRLRRAGVDLDVIPVEPAHGADVSVVAVDAPSRARPGDTVKVRVAVTATSAQQATVTLLRDGKEVDRRLVDLPVGDTTVEFGQPVGDSGAVAWAARVSGPDNGVFENDESRSSTRIEGRVRVLVVEGVPGNGATLGAAFGAAGIDTTVTEPERLRGLSDLAAYDVVVLVNVGAARLNLAQTAALSSAVRDLGKGLLVVGGTSSYGAGDYLGSALEELLPVTSEAKDPKRRSKVAQVFAVDVSGSMGACHCADGFSDNSRLPGGVTKTDIARDSTVRALEGFQPDDEVGVLALDDRQRWLLELGPVGDGSDARKQMGGIEHSEGSTNLDPSLTMSAERLRQSSASLRHIVLFTDGFTDQSKLSALAVQAGELRNEGITVSVMGTGEGASAALRDIADEGGGRYYAGRDLKELPDLLLEETKVVARQLIVEGEFLPEIASTAPVVAGLTSSPPLGGYLATTPKPTATQHLRIGEEKDPLLAAWRVGLGQVASWTSDGGERWTGSWRGWDGAVPFWSDVVRSILSTPAGAAQMRFQGATAMIDAAFDQPMPDGAEVFAQVVDPSGRARRVRLDRVDDRNFTGSSEVGGAGTYGLGVSATVDGETTAAISSTAELGFSREYVAQPADVELLEDVSLQTGGRGVIRPRQAFDAAGLTAGRDRVDLRTWLLIAALVLWPFAVALSRIRRRGSALAVASLPRRTSMGDLAGTLASRRRRPDQAPRGEPTTRGPQPPPPASPPAPPRSSGKGAPLGTEVKASSESSTPEASAIDSLLAAKRRRARDD